MSELLSDRDLRLLIVSGMIGRLASQVVGEVCPENELPS